MNLSASAQAIGAVRPALPAANLGVTRHKGIVAGFWIVTALCCLQIGFTVYAQLSLPQVAEAFTCLEAWGFAAGTGVLWALSYSLWRRMESAQARRARG